VAGSNGDGQGIHAGPLGKLDRLVGIGDVIEARAARAIPSSTPPSTPISPSTVTPRSWAKSTTLRVTSTFSSDVEGVLPSAFSEPSIMTEV